MYIMGILNVKIILQRATLGFTALLFAIPFSLLITFLGNTQASAASTDVDAAVETGALSYTYYVALNGCASYRLRDVIKTSPDTPTQASASTWYGTSFSGADPYVYPSGTKTGCEDLLRSATKLWGITDYGAFLKGMGYVYNASVPEYRWSSGNSNARTNAFKEQVKKVAPAGTTDLSDAEKYVIFMSSLTGDCKARDMAGYVEPFKTYADQGKRDGDYIFSKVTTSSGERVFKRLYGGSYTVFGYVGSNSSNAGAVRGQDCANIVNGVSSAAPAYASAEAQGYCRAQTNYTEASLVTACANGFVNKTSDLSYCKNTYAGTYSAGQYNNQVDQRKACYSGQGNPGAYSCIEIGHDTGMLLQACINGTNNQSNPQYCETAYVGVYSAGQATDRTAERNACTDGLTLSKDPSVEVEEALLLCESNPDDVSCVAGTSCAVPGVGWIVCPIFNFLAGITDASYSIVEGFLITDIGIVDTDSGTYSAWQIMRNIANVGFVIVFLIITFAQLTGAGISSYGIKKLLPRLVVGAILVNISFFVSQLAVDMSNILGGSIKNVFDSLPVFDEGLSSDVLASGNLFTDITAGILGGQLAITAIAGVAAVAYFGGLGLLIPIILAAVLAVVMTLFILIARQAFIVLLVVLSPLAFLAMLLPNTESFFKQWRKIFLALLIIYPAIALLFGASKLASAVLLTTFAQDDLLGQLVSIAVLILPLFAIPALLKGSLNAIPVVGGMASKFASRANGLVGKQAKQGYAKSTFGRSAAIRRQGKEAFRARRFAENAGKQGSVSNMLAKGLGITKEQKYAGSALERNVTATNLKAEEEETNEAKSVLANANLSGAERQIIAKTGSYTSKTGQTFSGETMQRAAIQEQFRTGSYQDKVDLANLSSSSETGNLQHFKQTISTGVATSGVSSDDPALAGKSIDDISQGSFNYDTRAAAAIKEGKYTARVLSTMHDSARTEVIRVATEASANGDPSLLKTLQVAAKGVSESPELRGNLSSSEVSQAQIKNLSDAP